MVRVDALLELVAVVDKSHHRNKMRPQITCQTGLLREQGFGPDSARAAKPESTRLNVVIAVWCDWNLATTLNCSAHL